MKILFDITVTQPINGVKIHGGGRYGEIIFKTLVAKTKQISCYYNSELYLDKDILQLCKSNKIKMIDCNKSTLENAVKSEGNIIYTPLIFQKHIDLPNNILLLGTIHGLRSLELTNDKLMTLYPHKGLKNYFRTVILRYVPTFFENKNRKFINSILNRQNTEIYTVSYHSKYSLLTFFPSLSEKKIKVFYSPSTVNKLTQPRTKETKFYLLIGGGRWEKNVLRALFALDQIFDERPSFEGKVVVIGVEIDKKLLKRLRNKDRFQFLGFVDNDTLSKLYRGAYLFIFPTLNEGFGYPPIEAMSCGTPVIASSISSIPEICGDAVLYFNPYSISEIKMRILAMDNGDLHKFYSEKGILKSMEIGKRQEMDLEGICNDIISHM